MILLYWHGRQKNGALSLTHDIETMRKYANERIAAGLPMPGVILVRDVLPIGQVIDDLLIIISASEAGEPVSRKVRCAFFPYSHVPLIVEAFPK